MDFSSIGMILFGSTFGLMLRIILQKNWNIKIGFDIQNISIVNFIASFSLGILVALNFINSSIFLLFYVGFLGSFSSFSSFIYQLFILFQKKKYLILIYHYLEVILISLLLFYLGYYLIKFF